MRRCRDAYVVDRHEARTQDGAERPIAEDQPARRAAERRAASAVSAATLSRQEIVVDGYWRRRSARLLRLNELRLSHGPGPGRTLIVSLRDALNIRTHPRSDHLRARLASRA